MKAMTRAFQLAFCIATMSGLAWGQDCPAPNDPAQYPNHEFRSQKNGPWSDTQTWEEYHPETNTWCPAEHVPSSEFGDIVIQRYSNGTADTVWITSSVSADQLTVYGRLEVRGGSGYLTVTDDQVGPVGYDLTVWGKLAVDGGLTGGRLRLRPGASAHIRVGGTFEILEGPFPRGNILSSSGGVDNEGDIFIEGIFRWEAGTVTGNPFRYNTSTAVTLVLAGGADSTSMATFWPDTYSPRDLYVIGSGVMLKTPKTVKNLYLSSTMDCTNLTVNGNLEIRPGGLVTGPPSYGRASQLWYHTGGSYARNAEWSADSGAGYPANIYIQGTTLDYTSGRRAAGALSGELAISNDSALRMDLGNASFDFPLTVGGNVYLQGALALSNAPAGDLHVRGREWIHGEYSTFTPNSRNVVFEGSAEQFISGPAIFDGLTVNNPAGVRLFGGWSIGVKQRLAFTAGNLVMAGGTLTLEGIVIDATKDHHVATPSFGRVRRLIASQDGFQFPIAPTAASYNPVTIVNLSTSTQPITFHAVARDSSSHLLPSNAAVLRREWRLESDRLTSVRLTFQWEASDPVIGPFNPAAGVAIGWYDPVQSNWTETQASYDPGPPQRATASFPAFTGGEFIIANLGALTSVGEKTEVPTEFTLYQNHPNPFNPTTIIRYVLPKAGHTALKVYDLSGKEIATLVSEKQAAGMHEVRWNAAGVASGVYVYVMRAGEFTAQKKLLLMK